MVRGMIDAITEIARDDGRAVILVGDDLEVYDALAGHFPDRVINIGISECNAVSVAAGLSSCGHVPFVIGGNSFMAYRAYEFIRDQLCMQSRNVKVMGIGAGMANGMFGNTHCATEDMASLRALPGLTIMTPATPGEVRAMVSHSMGIDGPVFIRVGRSCGTDFYDSGHQFEGNKIQMLKEGRDIAAFSTGSVVCQALEAAGLLEAEGIRVGVYNVHTIKPLDTGTLVQIGKDCHKWVSIEEHNVIGGLGGALSEAVVDAGLDVRLKKVGLNDAFAKGCGTHDDIKKNNGLGMDDIVRVFREVAKG